MNKDTTSTARRKARSAPPSGSARCEGRRRYGGAFGDVLVWDEITDIEGDIVLEEGGFENCFAAIR